jgi:L-malate glycosyltransferase
MSICVLHMSSEKGWRGGERQLAYLLEDLIGRNVRNVLAVKSGSGLEVFSRERRIPFHTIKYSSSVDLFSAFRIHALCSREKIDLIHLHSSKAHGVGALSSFFGSSVPMVLSRRVAFSPGRNVFSRWKYNHKRIKKILCVSERIKEIMQEYVVDGANCVTIYSGIDLKKFVNVKPDREFLLKEFNLGPAREVIVAIGALDKSKDHFTFVDTIDQLIAADKPVQGLIVGDGPLALSLETYVRKKGLSEYVKFAGHRTDIGIILASADIFLMTSREEGLGTSLLDAFLTRVPVVATAAGGIPELVRHMETGLLAPVQDPLRLSDNIVRLLSDSLLRKRLVESAYSFVMNFSREETSSKTYKVYQEVLSR